MSDADQEALAQMIRAAVEEAQKRPPTPAIASSAIAQPAVPAQPATTTQPTSQPAKAGCGAAGGPPIDLTPPPVDQPQPKLVCQQKKVAAENVWQGKTAEFAFTIANEGEAPLAIRIKPGWGVKINGQSDRLISPGQSDSVVISMSTGPRRGKLQRTITVQSNDRENPSVGLECEAEILSALKCDPETVNLGTIKRTEERVEKTVKITRGSAGPIQPKIASTGSPQVTAELREIEPGENYELDIVAQPPWPNGMLRANLQVQTGIEQAPTESITVFGNVVARAQASPQRFMIRPDKKEANLVARLNWDDNNPGRITAVTVSDPKLTADVEEQEQQQIIVLHVPPDYSTPTGRTTQVNVQTDDPAVPVLQIPVFVLAGTSGATAPPAGAARPAESPAARRARLSPAPSPPVPVATPVGPSPSPSSAPAEDAEAK